MAKNILVAGCRGYIGSQVTQYLADQGHRMYGCDLDLFQTDLPAVTPREHFDFGNLSRKYLDDMDVVVLLAGYSSAGFCQNNKIESFKENCEKFFALERKLPSKTTFIYASSASVYGNTLGYQANENIKLSVPFAEYDKQKQLLDLYMTNCSLKHWYGLRFGTVCGRSQTPRNELIINSMVKSAKQNKVIRANGSNHRAILGMRDLCRAISALVDQQPTRGIYNLASFDTSIEDLGRSVAGVMGVPYKFSKETTSPYSFRLDTTKFETALNFEFMADLKSVVADCIFNNQEIVR